MINFNDEKLPERIQELAFDKILTRPENASCADCNAKGPRWVSLNFGVFICMRCSGAHRSLGPVYTKVRSVKLDNWTRDTLNIMDKIGNKIANEYFESSLEKSYRKPDYNSTQFELEKYIHDKYVKRIYSPIKLMDPVSCFLEGKEKAQKSEAIKEPAPAPLISKEIKQSTKPTKPLPPFKSSPSNCGPKDQNLELLDFTEDLVFDDFQSPPLESDFTDFHGPTDLAPHPKQNILDLYKEQPKEVISPQTSDSRNYNALNGAFMNNNYGNLNAYGMNYMSQQNMNPAQHFNYAGQKNLLNQQNMIGNSPTLMNQQNLLGAQINGQSNLMNQQNLIGQSNLGGQHNLMGSQNLMGQQQIKGQPMFFYQNGSPTHNETLQKGDKAKNSGDIMALYARKDDTALNNNEMQLKNGGKKENMMGMYNAGSFNVW